ncbi:MAG: hypothetical protein ABUS49_02350 [Acidobacteriota bacterium]
MEGSEAAEKVRVMTPQARELAEATRTAGCLTRWAEHMDPYILAYLAGHSDFGMTKRYVHPQKATIRKAMEKV